MTIEQAQLLPWEFVAVGVVAIVVGAVMVVRCDKSWRAHVWYCPKLPGHTWTGREKKCPRCGAAGSTVPFEHNLVRTVPEVDEPNENFEPSDD